MNDMTASYGYNTLQSTCPIPPPKLCWEERREMWKQGYADRVKGVVDKHTVHTASKSLSREVSEAC